MLPMVPMLRQRRSDVSDDVLVNLNARVPRGLRRRLKIHCSHADQMLRAFVTEAIDERLHPVRRRRS